MSNIPTPHITAGLADFAQTVLMPGDPLRSKFIAENFLEDAKLINNVRGVQGYTGYYNGKRVSVMASGMGMPAMGIYAHELFNFYDIKQIIRVGSAGAVHKDIKIGEIVLCSEAFYTSAFPREYLGKDFIAKADPEMLEKAEQIAKEKGFAYRVGKLYSSDVFYSKPDYDTLYKEKVLAVEMESAALYAAAYKANKKALTICTISDNIVTGEALDAESRQKQFKDMMVLALELA